MAGYNFRATAGFVTDGPDDIDVLGGSDVYPQSGVVDFGWDAATGLNTRDRDAAIDPRLAGINFINNTETFQRLFVANTGNGVFNVTLAIGDEDSGPTNSQAQICDVDTSNVVQSVLATPANGVNIPITQWFDATGVLRTSVSDWVNNNAPLQVTVTSGRLGIRIGFVTNEVGATPIAHFAFEAVVPIITPSPYTVLRHKKRFS